MVRPEGKTPTLIYDGDCGICLAAAEWLRERDPGVGMVPYQKLDSERLADLGLTLSDCQRAVRLVTADGRVMGGHRAINHLLWRWSAGRALVVILWIFPPLLVLEWVGYRLIAANRRRISVWLGFKACAIQPTTAGDDER